MIILHGSASDGQFLLWGECTPEAPRKPSRKAGRAVRSHTPLASRFALESGRLIEAVASEIAGFKVSKGQTGKWFGWFPTQASRGALPSSPLLLDEDEASDPVRISPWEVPAIALTDQQVLEVLLAVLDRTTWGAGIVVGNSLAYWGAVLRFAGALVARQSYLPGIVLSGDDTAFQARWEPVLTGEERIEAQKLTEAMPHACRALGQEHAKQPGCAAPVILGEVVGKLVDQLVRGSIREKGKSRAQFTTLHDQWLGALQSPDGRLKGPTAELASLVEQVQQWRKPLEVAASAPFRLCLRLEEPEAAKRKGERPGWRVSYLLQAIDDLSLLAPAEVVWKGSRREAAVLKRNGFEPRECLLTALGQAASLCPRIEGSLRSPTPAGYELDDAGAHQFLTETAIALEQAGFGVFLPAWWTRKGTKLRLAARAVLTPDKMKSKAGLSLESLLNFHWEVALGEERLTLKELQTLAKLKSPLVRLRGQWVELNPEEIQAAIEFWKKKGDSLISTREALSMALGLAQPPGSLEFQGVEASGWIADLIAQLEGSAGFEPLDTPEGFRGVLRPYQSRGFSWLSFLRRWGLGACLADDMGLGKTIQTLALIQREWELRPARQRKPTLLICPTSVVGNWHKEAGRFTPDLPVLVHHGLERTRGASFKKKALKHGLVLSSYALLHRDLEHFQQVPWSTLVLDEAQNIKNSQTKQAQAARALRAEHRIALTGTPVENHVGDLWSIIEFLNPGWLGTQAEFKRTFHVPIQVQRDAEASNRLKQLTGPFIMRRLKTDKTIIADLPEKLEMKVFCTLTKEQASLYAAVVEDITKQIESHEGIQRKGLVLSLLMKLKQVCNHPAQFLKDNSAIDGRSGKLLRLTEMLEEMLSAGDRALVFTQFAEMGAILRGHLQETFGREVFFLHGGTPKTQRDRMVARFQDKDGAIPIFILSLKAGGTGLNLTAASHVFHFDRWWNPAVENQATDRAFRIGQTQRVQVHKFVCMGTLEEKIDALIENKKEIAGSVLGSGESWLTKLSNAELKDLLTLRQEALSG